MRVLVLYLPLPVFWALFDQQGSRWTIQATRMDGDMGSWDIKPDQMQMINPFLILAFIPLYELAFYPLLAFVGIRRPLQKLTLGGIFAGIAFVVSGLVELSLEVSYFYFLMLVNTLSLNEIYFYRTPIQFCQPLEMPSFVSIMAKTVTMPSPLIWPV